MKHKFKAWDKELKEMFDVADIEWDNHERCEVRYACGTEYVGPGRAILLQYTGLKDKNEQEIYEGYILELVKDPVEYLEATNRIYTRYSEVIFLDGAFRLVNPIEKIGLKDGTKSIYELFDIGFYDTKEYYIKVGNIFQNPELLEIK